MSRSGASEPLLHAHGSVSEEERHAEARESDALLSPRSPSAFARLRLSDTDLVSGLTHREAAHRLNHFGPNEQTRRPRSGASEESFFRNRGAGEIGKRDKSASLLDACRDALFSNNSKMPPDWATRACLVALAAATVQTLFVLSAYVDANASGTDTSADDVKNKLAIKNACVDLVAAVVLLVTHVTTVTIYVRRATSTTKTTRASYVSVTRRAHVIRDGKTRLVDPKELVPGDVVVVKKGDVAPADILLSAQSDETVLVSVSADGTDLANVIRSGDVLPRGAEVRAGEARGIVARTGDFSGDFSVFGSTRVDDVTRGYSRDDDSARSPFPFAFRVRHGVVRVGVLLDRRGDVRAVRVGKVGGDGRRRRRRRRVWFFRRRRVRDGAGRRDGAGLGSRDAKRRARRHRRGVQTRVPRLGGGVRVRVGGEGRSMASARGGGDGSA
jgi:hypothetical protein